MSPSHENNVIEATTAVLGAALNIESVERFWIDALPNLVACCDSDNGAVFQFDEGNWIALAKEGNQTAPPESLLADALDRESIVTEGGWSAAPIRIASVPPWVLAASTETTDTTAFRAAVEFCRISVEAIARRIANQQRLTRLDTILDIVREWNKTHEMEPLLNQMAEAATKMFDADRASIFLWDRDNKLLVGRPALGVEGGELRIPDNKGVVGEVVQTGKMRRVDRRHEQQTIDRSVDQQLGYQTATLLCVPLHGEGGEICGAFELINKKQGDFTAEDEVGLIELATHAATALENTQQVEQLLTRQKQMIDEAAAGIRLIGESPAMQALRSTVTNVARSDLAVLILGENGTGKEVASQSIHYGSPRRDGPFVAVNCAALPDTLLESELFGHEKGAFTDAQQTRVGKFELAIGGTLFLDEIGDLSLAGQAKLLRVLEEKIITRIGGTEAIHVDVRILAATNQGLAEMVREKTFREDLYYRLNVVTLEMPPLRDRGDDISLLAEHFLSEFAKQAGRKTLSLTAAAKKRLRGHSWPGNVRELRNMVERLTYLSASDRIDTEELMFILDPGSRSASTVEDDLPLTDATTSFQQHYIRTAIDRAGGNMSEAATRLGLHRSNLYRKMKQLDMPT